MTYASLDRRDSDYGFDARASVHAAQRQFRASVAILACFCAACGLVLFA